MKDFYKIGFGTWEFGGREKRSPDNDDARDIACIRKALDMGIRHIDTAAFYAAGHCEELVGEAIKGFDRKGLFIASKVKDELGYDDVLRNFENSTKRLGIDYLDLYYVHFPKPGFPISETSRAFSRLHEDGLIKNIGICNAKVSTLQEYQKHLGAPIFASQCHYNLIAREPERTGLIEFCRKQGIKFIAWRPIQLRVPSLGIEPLHQRGVYPLLDEISDKYGKTNAQIAVKWLISQENVHIIFKSANEKHIREILDCTNFEMDEKDLADLRDNFPRQENTGFNSAGKLPLG